MKSQPAYYLVDDYPALHDICRNWEIIRNEFLALNPPLMQISRGTSWDIDMQNVAEAIKNGINYGWIKGWGPEGLSDKWLNYGLTTFNEQFNELIKGEFINHLPKTYEMIRKIKGVKICGYANLKPFSILHCHNHWEIYDEGLLQFHLPIVTAVEQNYAYLNVRGEFRQHICGEPIIFDGSLDHFVLNESPSDRIILYMEFKK